MVGNRAGLAVALVLGLSACDNTPNQNFEQSMKDRDAANAGDAYARLETAMPQRRWYDPGKGEEYIERVKGASGNYRATYDGLVDQLGKDKEVDRDSALYKQCVAAYREASEYHSKSGDVAAPVADAREKALAALRGCRDLAKKPKDDETAALLARFASTGIAMIGSKVVAQGDQEAGIRIWAEGEKYVAEDKPGFQFGVKSFRGY